jgi:hypothetical protein
MRSLRAFALGAIAVGVLAYAGAAALAVGAQAAGRSLVVGLGPLVVVSVEREASDAVTTFGPGLLVVSIVGGCVNLAAARLVRWKAGGRRGGVE